MPQKSKTKKKNQEDIISNLAAAAGHASLAAMAVAAVATVVELHHLKGHTVPGHVHAAPGHEAPAEEDQMRRSMEETRHAHASYGAPMRSHPTAGTA